MEPGFLLLTNRSLSSLRKTAQESNKKASKGEKATDLAALESQRQSLLVTNTRLALSAVNMFFTRSVNMFFNRSH